MRTGINADREAGVGWDASAGAVQGQLTDGHPNSLDSQVPQSAHPLPISQADGLDAPLRPVLQQ